MSDFRRNPSAVLTDRSGFLFVYLPRSFIKFLLDFYACISWLIILPLAANELRQVAGQREIEIGS